MTTEEKAKRYDETLEKARVALNDGTISNNTIAYLQDIFPELAESEDERIRKALLEMVHDTTGDELWVDYNVHKEEALAWLEKQRNNTPTITWHSIDEKPEEMKELFCEWESDDSTWHDVAFYDRESHTFRRAKRPINVTKWVYVDELLEKQGEQKPAAWSDEDEHRVEDTIYFLDTAKKHYACTIELDACIDWLKSLKKQNRRISYGKSSGRDKR